MNWYCKKCRKIHSEDEMCPSIKKQLRESPELLSAATDFITVASEDVLISSQALDVAAQQVNKIAGTKLTYEGTQQFARDIQVFKRLNEEPFSKSGVFSSPDKAKSYYENVLKIARDKPKSMTAFEGKLTGYSQEVDWIRLKHGELSSVFEKSTLLNNNAPGVDGITVNRFTGKEISRTTIKASKNPMTANSTAINDVKEAIAKGNATEKDIIFGPKGTEAAARKAGLSNPVIEKNTAQQIQKSNERLEEKILNGKAVTAPTMQQVGEKMAQGAVVGAAIAVSVSTITSYIRYKNGELTKEEAYKEVGEETLKGALIGAAMGAVTIFLPGGAIGYIAGIAIGIYFNTVCTNVLDEIFGKGAYGAILDASGYVYGMTINLAEYYRKIEMNDKKTRYNIEKAKDTQKRIDENFVLFEKMKGE